MTKTYETVKLDKLKPYANNPRNNDNAVPAVKASIQQVGYITPIVVDENYEILAGHTRYKALKALGRKEAEILRIGGCQRNRKRSTGYWTTKQAKPLCGILTHWRSNL